MIFPLKFQGKSRSFHLNPFPKNPTVPKVWDPPQPLCFPSDNLKELGFFFFSLPGEGKTAGKQRERGEGKSVESRGRVGR